MGLDMNFYKRTYLDPKRQTIAGEGLTYPDIRVQEYTDFNGNKRPARIINKVKYVVEDAGYMRKANAIHGFIVDRCFGGDEPNCQWITMSKDFVEELRDTCKFLLAHQNDDNFKELAEQQLPACEGFFFGPTEYDDFYIDCLKLFLEITDDWELDNDNVDYIYRPWY